MLEVHCGPLLILYLQGKDLVLQFSVKHEQDIDCGGGYLKLLPSVDAAKFTGHQAVAEVNFFHSKGLWWIHPTTSCLVLTFVVPQRKSISF